eukprot:6681572-Pyramimonas_sp.AAC.1
MPFFALRWHRLRMGWGGDVPARQRRIGDADHETAIADGGVAWESGAAAFFGAPKAKSKAISGKKQQHALTDA